MSTPGIPQFVWEPQTTSLLLYLSGFGKNVIVGGAYFGDQAILLADKIKNESSVVYAFDLNDKQLEILKKNSSRNKITNLNIVNKGLWSNSTTFLNLSDDDDLAFATQVDNSDRSNTVTIDEYMAKNNISTVGLIMLDIEGSELEVLKGAEQQLQKPAGECPNIVFEIHRTYVNWDNGLDNTDIVKYLHSFGYKIYSLRDFQGNYDMKGKKIELIPLSETYLQGPPHGFNMVAVKDETILENEIFSFCSGVSPKYLVHKDPQLHHPMNGL